MFRYNIHQMMSVIFTALLHLTVTLPSFIYHGSLNLYNRIITPYPIKTNLYDANVVIFVHGRGGHYSDFKSLIYNIKILGTYSSNYLRVVDLGNTRNTSIDDDANKLKEELEIYKNCNICLVGLSKGGVVVMRYITTIKDNRIRKVITISSPLMGTKLASLLPKNSITYKELSYDSKLTQEIASNKFLIPICHIVPKWDHVIIPSSSAAYLNTYPGNIYYYKGFYNHVGIVHDKEIAKIIAKWILIGASSNPNLYSIMRCDSMSYS